MIVDDIYVFFYKFPLYYTVYLTQAKANYS